MNDFLENVGKGQFSWYTATLGKKTDIKICSLI